MKGLPRHHVAANPKIRLAEMASQTRLCGGSRRGGIRSGKARPENTETANKDGTWLQEISSCCCLPTAGKTTQLLLKKIYIPFLPSLYIQRYSRQEPHKDLLILPRPACTNPQCCLNLTNDEPLPLIRTRRGNPLAWHIKSWG